VTDLNPEQVRRIRDGIKASRGPLSLYEDEQFVIALCDSWLAQGEALAAAHKFAGDILLFANDPRVPTVHDFIAVSDEAERIKNLLADAALASLSNSSPTTTAESAP